MTDFLKKLFLSVFFVGFIPPAPGTLGSLVSVLLILLTSQWLLGVMWSVKLISLIIFVLVLFSSSCFVIKKSNLGENLDRQWIVIDEFIGMLIAASPALFQDKFGWQFILISFILFRFFDILKPLGIKKIEAINSPVSVILDDVLAGFYALIASLFVFAAIV